MDTVVDNFLTVDLILVFQILVELRFNVLHDWSPTGDASGRYVVTNKDLDPQLPPAGRDIVGFIDERKPTVEVPIEHQILWPVGKLAVSARRELSTVHALEGFGLSSDEHGVELLVKSLGDGGSDKRHL